MNTGMNEHSLQALAYQIWEAEGRPLGQADRHWQMAMEQAHMEGDTDTLGTSTAGESFLGDDLTPNDQTLLQDERQYALQNNLLDETSQTTMEAEGINTAEQPLESSPSSEKIGGKRKTKAKAKSAATLADQDISSESRSKPSKRKSSNNILV